MKTLALLLGSGVMLALVIGAFQELETTGHDENDFLSNNEAGIEFQQLIRTACYDCHSMETRRPFYAYFFPVSSLVIGHVEHGRKELNFSRWETLGIQDKMMASKGVVKTMHRETMPLDAYTLFHPSAELTRENRILIKRTFLEFRKQWGRELLYAHLGGVEITFFMSDSAIYNYTVPFESNEAVNLQLADNDLLTIRFEAETGLYQLYIREVAHNELYELSSAADSIYLPRDLHPLPVILYCRKKNARHALIYKDLETYEEVEIHSFNQAILDYEI